MPGSIPAWGSSSGLLLGLLLVGALYLRGVGVLWRRAGHGKGVGRLQVAAFVAGSYVLVSALFSPLDALSHLLFSAHMAQHMLLVLVAAPLLVYSAPLVPLLWGLPARGRRALVRGWRRSSWAQRTFFALTAPASVWLLFALALWIWHLPTLYQAALHYPAVHILEHASLLAAAALFWWLILQPLGRRRLNYGAAVIFIFTTSVHSTVLSALLTFAPTPLYPVYGASVQLWGITPLEDQRFAGLVMRLPMSLTFLLTAAALFLLWLRALEAKVQGGRSSLPPDVFPSR